MTDTKLGNNKIISIQNLKIDVLTEDETVNLVKKYIEKREPLHLMGVNADKVNLANENNRIKTIINNCGIVNADGASLVMASKFLGDPLPERVAGIDLMMDLIQLSSELNYRVYLLGAKEEVLIDTVDKLKKQFPGLNIVGSRNGYFSEDDWESISRELINLSPNLVFVGITSPKKEYVIDYFQSKGSSAIFMGVGGSFDVISGKISRAPKWMQKANLEWLYRVYKEPKRLFKRYFVGNVKFMKNIWEEKRSRK